MNFLLPILATVFQASSYTLDKIILSIGRVTYKTYNAFSFPIIFIISLVIFLATKAPFSSELFAGKLFWIFLISTAAGIVSNLLFYRALDDDKLGEVQTIGLVAGIPVILFSGLIFADERKLYLIVPALLASLAIVWSHWENHHLRIERLTLSFLLSSLILAPIRVLTIKVLLYTWSPITFQLAQAGIMSIIVGLLFPKALNKIPTKAITPLITTNLLSTIAIMIYFFSFQKFGVVQTVLIFSLQPLLVYFASLVFLKEKFHCKKFAAFLVVLGSIAVAQILK